MTDGKAQLDIRLYAIRIERAVEQPKFDGAFGKHTMKI